MKIRSSRQEKKRHCVISRGIRRIAFYLWCLALGTCVWVSISNHQRLIVQSKEEENGIVEKEEDNSSSQREHPLQNKVFRRPKLPQRTMKQAAEAAKSNKEWIQRRYKLGDKIREQLKQKQEHYYENLVGGGEGVEVGGGKQEEEQNVQHHHAGLPIWVKKKHNNNNEMTGLKGTVYDNNNNISDTTEQQCNLFNQTFLQPNHGCDLNKDLYTIHCQFQGLRIDTNKIILEYKGGEPLHTVMGRRNGEKELPKYQPGAFTTGKKPTKPHSSQQRKGGGGYTSLQGLHYLDGILSSMRKYPSNIKPDQLCTKVYTGTTMFITRYEYVNLYHTVTDWWNTYFSLPRSSTTTISSNHTTDSNINDRSSVRIVFLDAHAEGMFDVVWEKLFGKVSFIQHLLPPAKDEEKNDMGKEDGSVSGRSICFEKAIMIPSGYSSPIYPQKFRTRCPNITIAEQFTQHILQSYQLSHVKQIKGKIVIINRVPYISHPRQKLINQQQQQDSNNNDNTTDIIEFKRIITNFNVLRDHLITKLRTEKVSSVELIELETLNFKEQLQMIREAHIVIGNHGAGLTHILFMDNKSHVIELSNDDRDFFLYLSEWKGIEHTIIPSVDNGLLPRSTIERITLSVMSILYKKF